MKRDLASEVGRSAEALFTSGLYCAESVLLAMARAQGVQSDLLPKLASGFCSGMARTAGPCGALTGAVLAIGLATGRYDPSQSLEGCYALTGQLVRRFEQEFGARNCSDLLGCDLGCPEGRAAFEAGSLHERCRHITGRTAEIAARLVFGTKEP